jgi:hypothetical protein
MNTAFYAEQSKRGLGRHAEHGGTRSKQTAFGTRRSRKPALTRVRAERGGMSNGPCTSSATELEGVLRVGTFNPAIYCHQSDFADLFPAVTAPFVAAGRGDRPRFWVVGGPAGATLTAPPSSSSIPEASMWQQRLDFAETHIGITLNIDRNVGVLPNPSARDRSPSAWAAQPPRRSGKGRGS